MDTESQILVQDYLSAVSDRQLDAAVSYLSDDVVLVFPQGRFSDLETMTATMAGRYSTISKAYDTWDVFDGEGASIVVTTGTLSGVNTRGVEFSGIRFCDRFVLKDGRICEQHVWNDLAESGVLSTKDSS